MKFRWRFFFQSKIANNNVTPNVRIEILVGEAEFFSKSINLAADDVPKASLSLAIANSSGW